MKKSILLFIFVFLQICIFAQNIEHYLKIYINDRSELDTLTQMVSIAKVVGNEVIAYANDVEFEKLHFSSFIFEELEHPSTQTRAITMATTVAEMANWDRYPTYNVYNQLMAKFVTDYPNLCKLDTVGKSVQNRNILALTVTADIHNPKPKPEVLFSSTIHGNETTGWILCMRLAHYLMSNYGTDTRITNMLDSISICIAPNTNPDGTYWNSDNNVAGARRNNANNFDLNRNFPDPRTGQYPNGARQKETTIMMDFAEARHFILGINYHGGTEVVNYPWDTWKSNQNKHADNNWYIQICSQYANLAKANGPAGYFTDTNYSGITNGGDWYVITGGRQDYMNYWRYCREVTLEVSIDYILGTENLQNFWNYNKEAMLSYIENVKYGIRGMVTNTDGEPLAAKITVIGHDKDNSNMVTNPEFGNYYRMIEPGNYTLQFESDGYISQTFTGISSQLFKTTILDVVMEKPTSYTIDPLHLAFETEETTGETIITILNTGEEKITFSAAIEDENPNWLSISNNFGTLKTGEKQEITLLYDFTSMECGIYETNIQVAVKDSVTIIPISILFYGCEEEIAIPYVSEDSIYIETEELSGEYVLKLQNIGNASFDYALGIEPEECEWLSLSHDSGTLEAAESVDIVLSFVFSPITKNRTIYSAILNIEVLDTVISIPITIKLLIIENILSQETESIKIFPNPTTGQLRIEVEGQARNDLQSVEIFDVYGRKILEPSLTVLRSYDLTVLQAGIYFLKIETEEGIVVKKVIKN